MDDGEIDLAGAALARAALDRPETPLDWYRSHLDQLASTVAAAPGGVSAAERLATVIAGLYGYQGDTQTYEDLQNANLMRVIDRRRGLPVALGIIYLDVGRRQGWPMAGLNFPGHFMVRLDGPGGRAILDPFNGGITRDTADLRGLLKAVRGHDAELLPEHYAPVSNRDILLRLQNNIKLRLVQAERLEDALPVIDGMLLLAPDSAALWREAGLINAGLDNLTAAVAAMERVLAIGGDNWLMHETATVLQRLKARLN